MGNSLPSMDSAGWVTGVAQKADRLMAYYFTTEHSQSNLYHETLTSLPKQIQEYGTNELRLVEEVRIQLERYFGRYFDTVEANVTTDRKNPEDPNRLNLSVDVIVTENGMRYSVGHEIQVVDSKIMGIIRKNNFGER